MEFRVLGPLEVVHARGTLALGGAKQRAVLAVLILRQPEVVSADMLIDAIWGERPPRSAPHAVQVYISALRKALLGAAESEERDDAKISTVPASGYQLVVDADNVDARRFERLVQEGRRTAHDSDFEDAERALGQALGLWRGPAYAGFAYSDFTQIEIRRLEDLRIEALEAHAKALVELGEYPAAVGELEPLVADHWRRENAWGLLMRALSRAGRQADALAAYHKLRSILDEELGTEPSPELRKLHDSILLQTDLPGRYGHGRREADASAWVRGMAFPPPGLSADDRVAFVGRVHELALVRERWTATRAGLRHGVMVSGEPGIGKTRFAFQAARELHEAGALVLFGRCPEELAAPYGAWAQALEPLIKHTPNDVLAMHAKRYGDGLARLVPALADSISVGEPRQTDPDTEPYLLFSSVVGFLRQASAVAPVVLLFDDLHWADRTTLALLKHVIAETPADQLLILATFRESELTARHPLEATLADLQREQRIDWLPLPGLDEREVLSLVEAAADRQSSGARRSLVRAIRTETGGNPFYVRELLRHLSESGELAQPHDDRIEEPRLGVPRSLRSVIGQRVKRLGEECCHVLTCASVIGAQFEFDLLECVVELGAVELDDALKSGVDAGLIEEVSDGDGITYSYSFVHNLIPHALADALGGVGRARVHRRIGEALEALPGDRAGSHVEELARHWVAALPRDRGKAQVYSKQAGERALANLAPAEAVHWFGQALKLAESMSQGDSATQRELSILLGKAQRQAGRPEFRATLLNAAKAAETIGDAERMAHAVLANSRGFASSFGKVDQERVTVLERAIELNREANPVLCARLLSLEAMELQFDPDYRRRRARADEALALALKASDNETLTYVLRDYFHATWSVDTLEERRRTAEEMCRLADGAEDPLVRIWALDRTIHVGVELGALSEAEEQLARLQDLTATLGQPGLRWHGAYYASGLAHLRGDLREAERLADLAKSFGDQAGEPDTAFVYYGQIAMVRAEQGRGRDVVELLRTAATAYDRVSGYQAGYAAVLCDMGEKSDAAPLLDSRAALGFDAIPRDQLYSAALALWTMVAVDLDAERAAAQLYALIEPWRRQLVWTGGIGYGSAETYLGMLASTLGLHDQASEHFAAATCVHEREHLTGWEARNQCELARSRLAAGATGDALAAADLALRLARVNGYKRTENRAAEIVGLAEQAPRGRRRADSVLKGSA